MPQSRNRDDAMRIDVLTIFPSCCLGILEVGMIRRARQKKLLEVNLVDLRNFTQDRHRTVDDRPFGGGEGMVMKPEPIFEAVESLTSEQESCHVVLLSPTGRTFSQQTAQRLARQSHLALICGRYEGVDQRVADHLVNEEISLGDYILSGGEIGAMALIDSISRLIPGVVGNPSSVLDESFMHGMLDHPHFTRPAEFRGWKVPDVLLSGDHDRVREWRQEAALNRTRKRRPDLLRSIE